MQLSEQEQEKLFENEARRIARELWPQAEHDGALNVDGRERDGIFETEECIISLSARSRVVRKRPKMMPRSL